jgi:ribose transport system substrate-binding protein
MKVSSMPRGLFRSRSVRPVRTLVALVALAGLVAGTAACRDDADTPAASASPSALPSGSAPPVDVLTEARNTVATLFKGTFKPPDPSTRIAAKSKKVAIISRGQSSPSSQVPVDAATDAARALGWDVTVLDLKLNPLAAPDAVRQAVALGVDGIVSNVDCAYAPNEFGEAKSKGIRITPLFAFDCTDPTVAGKPGASQFTTFLNFQLNSGEKVDPARYNSIGGVIAASAVIAATNGTAKVLAFTDSTSTILNYTHAGFINQMKRCKGCQILEEVRFTPAELIDGSLRAKVAAAIQRHPDVTAIRGSHSAAIQLAIAPEVVAAKMQSKVIVIGGEGQERDLDLIRTKQGLNMTLCTDSPWMGWAVIDALNSAFNGETPRFPGLGAMLVDRDHNLPPSGAVQHNVNFKNVYRKAWGVG